MGISTSLYAIIYRRGIVYEIRYCKRGGLGGTCKHEKVFHGEYLFLTGDGISGKIRRR